MTNQTQAVSGAVPVVESASASTACQTSPSRFAYGFAAAVLGVIAAFVISMALLVVEIASAAYDYDASARYYTWEEDRFGQNGWDDELYEEYGYLDDELGLSYGHASGSSRL